MVNDGLFRCFLPSKGLHIIHCGGSGDFRREEIKGERITRKDGDDEFEDWRYYPV